MACEERLRGIILLSLEKRRQDLITVSSHVKEEENNTNGAAALSEVHSDETADTTSNKMGITDMTELRILKQ